MNRFAKFAAIMSAAVSLSAVSFADESIFSGVYVKPVVGFVKPMGKVTTLLAESLAKKPSNSSMFGLAIGVEVAPGLRVELEASRRGNFSVDIAQAKFLDSTKFAAAQDAVLYPGSSSNLIVGETVISSSSAGASFAENIDFASKSKARATSLMFNGYYDIDLGSSVFTPFFGFGIGMSKIKADFAINTSAYSAEVSIAGNAPTEYKPLASSGTIKKNKITYAFALGTSVKLAEKMAAELKVQYIDFGKITSGGKKIIHPKAVEVLTGIRISL